LSWASWLPDCFSAGGWPFRPPLVDNAHKRNLAEGRWISRSLSSGAHSRDPFGSTRLAGQPPPTGCSLPAAFARNEAPHPRLRQRRAVIPDQLPAQEG